MQEYERIQAELTFLFGQETVKQAYQLDIADLSLNENMVQCIATGVSRLKELRDNPTAQKQLVQELQPGERLLLCLWIMDLDLIDKMQTRSYL